jgi:hypothetical protein
MVSVIVMRIITNTYDYHIISEPENGLYLRALTQTNLCE